MRFVVVLTVITLSYAAAIHFFELPSLVREAVKTTGLFFAVGGIMGGIKLMLS